ncbi:hypothetical protein BV20DRAFT_423959 [Pilatotrama ljubarskyi]|nr:hypothetical protein BV20DRAFT_423959 [Pilatotrama ljubarskyi]
MLDTSLRPCLRYSSYECAQTPLFPRALCAPCRCSYCVTSSRPHLKLCHRSPRPLLSIVPHHTPLFMLHSRRSRPSPRPSLSVFLAPQLSVDVSFSRSSCFACRFVSQSSQCRLF